TLPWRPDGGDEQPLEAHLDLGRKLALRPRRALRQLVRTEQVESRDVAAPDPLERRGTVDEARLAEALAAHLVEARLHELAVQRLRLGEARAVDRLERREEAVQPEAGEVAGVEGRHRQAAT